MVPITELSEAPRLLPVTSVRLHCGPPRFGESISSILDRAGNLWNLPRQTLIHEITGMSPGNFGDPDGIPDARAGQSLAVALNVGADHLAQFAAVSSRSSLLVAPAIRHAYCPLCIEQDQACGSLPGFQLDWGRFWLTHCRVHLTPLFDWKTTGRLGDRRMPAEWSAGNTSFRPTSRSWLNRHLRRAQWYAQIGPHHGEVYEQWKALLMFETALYCMDIGGPKGPPDGTGQSYEEILSQLMALFLAKPQNRLHPLPVFKLDPQFCDPDVFHLPASLRTPMTTRALRSNLPYVAGRRALILLVANVLGAVDHPLRFAYVRPSPSPGSKAWFEILLSLVRNQARGIEVLARADAYRHASVRSGGFRSQSDRVNSEFESQ